MSQLERFCELKGVTIDVTYGARLAWDKQADWQRQSNGYTCVLRYQKRKATFDFWMGSAHTREPTAADVLSALCYEVPAMFEEFCCEYGYSLDSISALKTYRRCLRYQAKARRLLGADYDAFTSKEH